MSSYVGITRQLVVKAILLINGKGWKWIRTHRAISNGGEGGIRTHDTPKGIPDFESGAFDHSATSPKPDQQKFRADARLLFGLSTHKPCTSITGVDKLTFLARMPQALGNKFVLR